jgi:hypothetical protein
VERKILFLSPPERSRRIEGGVKKKLIDIGLAMVFKGFGNQVLDGFSPAIKRET